MTEKTIITVGGVEIPMRASALVPRLYRVKFGRDMIRDMNNLEKKMKPADGGETALDALDAMDLTVFEDVAYILAKHADPEVPSDPDEWLDSIPGVLSIYEALPQILALWSRNLKTTSKPRKK